MRIARVSSFVLAALIAVPTIASAQVSVGGKIEVKVGAKVKVGSRPTQAPPPPVEERQGPPKRGQVWVHGYHEWKGGKWQWKKGRYQSRKKMKRWADGRWEQQGAEWVWVEGNWIDAPKEPEAPPTMIVEEPKSGRGQIWVNGYWEWSNGAYEWVPGKLVRRTKGKRWTDGSWAQVGGKWTWTPGAWVDGPKEPSQPPTDRDEKPQFKRGFVWVKGYWKWDDGDYEWVPGKLQKRPRNKRWSDGRWEQKGGKWEYSQGGFADAPTEPDRGPPPPNTEPETKPRKGYVWVKGSWEYKDGDYEWVAGRWEREKAGNRWEEPRWEQQGGKWVFKAGAWVKI